MGRRRQRTDPSRPLPPGLYRHGKQYRARLLNGPWRYFGTDYAAALAGYGAWRQDGSQPVGTVGWLLNLFVATVCPGRVKARQLSERTARDYKRDAEILKTGLGHIPLSALQPRHVVDYRDERAQDARSHVRNELACLSAALSYAVESGRVGTNVCREVARPSRERRMRLISDAEYLKVWEIAGASVRLAMALAVRTLALPADVLALGPRNLIRLPDGKRALRFQRGKTGVPIEIEVIGELERLIDEFLAQPVIRETFVHRRDGKPYTRDGIGAMFRRYCGPEKANVQDFGLRDLRAKGATDEYRAGRPLRELQHLLGHKSVKTTEIYLKELVPERVRPNERPIVAEVK
ncbi:MAG TPA: tyrosine-type recombinase/integrase [Casimicrobiaceae bacterium]|nr:tyrosine-type recombinase/integrase [Casimicrobiaceae bacterium]